MSTFTVEGMNCGHCTKAITQAIVELDANAKVQTDLCSKTVTVSGTPSNEQISQAITEAGYKVVTIA
jgi:copper chaperone